MIPTIFTSNSVFGLILIVISFLSATVQSQPEIGAEFASLCPSPDDCVGEADTCGLLFLDESRPLFRGGQPDQPVCGDETCTDAQACIWFEDQGLDVETCQDIYPDCEAKLKEINPDGVSGPGPAKPTPAPATPAPATPAPTKPAPGATPAPEAPVTTAGPVGPPAATTGIPTAGQTGTEAPPTTLPEVQGGQMEKTRQFLCCWWANLLHQCDANPRFMKTACAPECGTTACQIDANSPYIFNCPTQYNAFACGPKKPPQYNSFAGSGGGSSGQMGSLGTSGTFGGVVDSLIEELSGGDNFQDYYQENSGSGSSYYSWDPNDGLAKRDKGKKKLRHNKKCTNKHGDCKKWAREGQCTKNAWWMGTNCCVACNAKPTLQIDCPNIHTNQMECRFWAAMGRCDNPLEKHWMRRYCANSCESCKELLKMDIVIPRVLYKRRKAVQKKRKKAVRRSHLRLRKIARARTAAARRIAAIRAARQSRVSNQRRSILAQRRRKQQNS